MSRRPIPLRSSFNGAAPFQTRKYPILSMLFGSLSTLQWGRAFSDAEISIKTGEKTLKTGLQWGRAFSDAEIPPIKSRASITVSGFNGAAPFQTRKWRHTFQKEYWSRASMGPRLFRRGNAGAVLLIAKALQLQWGRAFSDAEMAPNLKYFNSYVSGSNSERRNGNQEYLIV